MTEKQIKSKQKENILRKKIIDTCIQMNALGINRGMSGNVSCRWHDGMLITPSGIPYEKLAIEDIVYIGFTYKKPIGPRKPSSEWQFHQDILVERKEIQAVVHTHSDYATAMAIHQMDIPAHHYMVAAAGGKTIRCAEYATFGTKALSTNALKALGSRLACLLANHGVIALGDSLASALWLANEVESLAKQFFISSQYGKPPTLSDGEMDRVLKAFEAYGPKKRHQSK